MNLREIIYGVLLILAFTSNFNFFYSYHGDFSIPNIIFLGIAIFLNFGVVFKKINDDEHDLGGVFLSTSIVALIQLCLAACILGYYNYYAVIDTVVAKSIISLSGGALLANGLSIVMYMIYTLVPNQK
jgi:hypothetical protein